MKHEIVCFKPILDAPSLSTSALAIMEPKGLRTCIASRKARWLRQKHPKAFLKHIAVSRQAKVRYSDYLLLCPPDYSTTTAAIPQRIFLADRNS